MEKNRILIIITKGDVGGAQMAILNTSKILKKLGYYIEIGFGEGEFLKKELINSDIPFHNFKYLKRSINPVKNLKFILELKKYLDLNNFNIIHFNSSNSLFGSIGAKLSKNKIKTIFTFHGLSVLDKNYKNIFIRSIYWILFKILLIFIDKNIFVSKNNLNTAIKNKLVKNGHVLYNTLDLKSFTFLNKNESIDFIEKKINISLKNKFAIGSIGRLSWEKNYKFLIEIFPKILEIEPNSICIIIGEGKEKKSLQKIIKKLKLEEKVFLIGEIQNASRYLKVFDIFILPSFYEGLSISLIESILADIKTIASDVGGNEEIIGKEFVYKLNDEKDFIEKFKNTLTINNSNYLPKKENFINENILEKIEIIYRK